MARFYANENFPLPVVEELRILGHDATTIQDTRNAGHAVSDEAVLNFAISENRTILTFNRKHFIRLHKAQPDHTGIIVCTFDHNFIALTNRIHQAINNQTDLSGQLIRINRPR